MPDFECTLWPDGIPPEIGGTGQEWLHCCIAHDLGGADTELAQCVAHSLSDSPFGILLALIMLLGVAGPPGLAYKLWKRCRKDQTNGRR